MPNRQPVRSEPPLSRCLRDSDTHLIDEMTCSVGEAIGLFPACNPTMRSFCLSVSGAVAPSALNLISVSRNPELARLRALGKQESSQTSHFCIGDRVLSSCNFTQVIEYIWRKLAIGSPMR